MEWLKGKKTYIVALGAVVTAIGAYLSGDLTITETIENVWTAIAAITIRAGIAKS